MNNTRGQQITPRGIAQRSGLEIFNTVTTYNGQYINWGDAFPYATQLGLDPDYTVNNAAADPHVDALVNQPQTVAGQWMRYHTAAGSNYATASAPTSGSGYYSFNGRFNSPNQSFSGIYQMMSLIEGVDYEIELTTPINTGIGALYINVYTPSTNQVTSELTYKLYSTSNIGYPIIRTRIGNVKSQFTAIDSKDIIVIYFTTLESSSAQNVTITNISVREKEEYLVPIYAEDMYGNSHKVLRIAADQTISNV
tara:strand:+ start:9628 stop:10383 length:756 start_codon:yes stop_codon:yes gene_type:complete